MADETSTSPSVYGGFRFVVKIMGMPDADATINQSFVRISGVESESEVMEYMQGTDLYKRHAPGRPYFADVEMERIYNGLDAFYTWRRQIETGSIITYDVTITLLDIANNPIRRMVCYQAWPKKWVMPALNAGSSEPAIERISLSVAEVYETEIT